MIHRFTVLPAVAGLLLAACGGGAQPAAPSAAPSKPAAAASGSAAAGGVSQALIDAAKKEGSPVWYTSVDLAVAEKVAKNFETKYGLKVEVNRTGSERVLQRVEQEAQAGVKAVDVIHTSDPGNFVLFKNQKLLMQYAPASAAKYDAAYKDKDGFYYVWRATLSVPAYNTKLIKPDDAPKSWKDLLEPKWKSKMVSAHPNYSGVVLTWTAALTDLYKTDYLNSLGKQDVMLVESAQDPATKVIAGERPLGINGTEYSYLDGKKKGNPIEALYPSEGVPLVTSPSAIAAAAPHPNAAKLFTEYLFDVEAQQFMVDDANLYSVNPAVKYPEGRRKLSELKLLTEDDDKLENQGQQIKESFVKAFGG